jgi:hypothetical protein
MYSILKPSTYLGDWSRANLLVASEVLPCQGPTGKQGSGEAVWAGVQRVGLWRCQQVIINTKLKRSP